MSVQLPDHDASKIKWTLECYSGKNHIPSKYDLMSATSNSV